jgi:tRNA (adenine37-N6)-methyltransferase
MSEGDGPPDVELPPQGRSTPPKDYRSSVNFPDSVGLQVIGRIHSPFTERFGTPRQACLGQAGDAADRVVGRVELFKDIVPALALRDLDGFDRAWLITWLHLNGPNWPSLVRPPRGGPRRGIFATRAPHRPNPIGLSAVRVLGVEGCIIHVAGLDLIDGTPVLDVKPYVAYADAFPEASAGWVDEYGGAPSKSQQPPDGPA